MPPSESESKPWKTENTPSASGEAGIALSGLVPCSGVLLLDMVVDDGGVRRVSVGEVGREEGDDGERDDAGLRW